MAFTTFGELLIVFLSKVNVTPKLIKMYITNLYLSKEFCPCCILVGVLKTFEPELSYILVELFNMCFKESLVLVFKNVGERSTAEKYYPVILLSMVTKIFEKYVYNRLVVNPVLVYIEKFSKHPSKASTKKTYGNNQ